MTLPLALLSWFSFGLLAGLIAWQMLRHAQPLGPLVPATLGIAAAILGGFVGWAVPVGGPLHPLSWVLSIAAAVLAVTVYVFAHRKRTNRTS
jgi:uncharacterized membrane protein YeaQ/YmgE (transglycosylase-associated protein family)